MKMPLIIQIADLRVITDTIGHQLMSHSTQKLLTGFFHKKILIDHSLLQRKMISWELDAHVQTRSILQESLCIPATLQVQEISKLRIDMNDYQIHSSIFEIILKLL